MKQTMRFFLLAGTLLIGGAATAQTTTTPAPKATTDTTALQAYVGTYSFVSGSPVQKYTVTSAKGELYGEADTMGKNKLVKQPKDDTYQSTSSYGAMITFMRDVTSKTVTSLNLAVQGTELSAKKDNP